MEMRMEKGAGLRVGGWPLDKGKQTLVFIHGAGSSSILWEKQVEGLKAAANTVAVDLPGHGRTPGPGRERIAEYSEWVVDLVRSLAMPRPIPVGLSMGGAIAQQLLIDHPMLFEAGVLISTGAKLKVMPMIFEAIEKDFQGYVRMMGPFSLSSKNDPKIIEAIEKDTATREPKTVSGDFRACDGFDARESLKKIKARVMVIAAMEDKLTPMKYGEFLAGAIPGAELVKVAEAGHLVAAEKPEEINHTIARFLAQS